jgi:hypothetical protein
MHLRDLSEVQISIYGKSHYDFSHECVCKISNARQVHAAWILGSWVGGARRYHLMTVLMQESGRIQIQRVS